MTEKSETPDPLPDDPGKTRLAEITTLFANLVALLRRTLEQEAPVTKATTQKALNTLKDLQAAHLMALRAEEEFHDTFNQDTVRDTLDYDRIRNDIGRALDRIRHSEGAGGVSDGAD